MSVKTFIARLLARIESALVIAIGVIAPLPLQSSELPDTIRFHRRGPSEGLSQAVVTDVAQDQNGFMWIGTQEGLNRFDGYGFEVFRHDPQIPSSLSHDWVRALLIDSHGVLWVGTEDGGLNRFNEGDKTFSHCSNEPSDPDSLSHDRVRAIVEDIDGALWVGTDGGGLNRFESSTGKFRSYVH